jgi:hypothetical protein
VDAGGNLAALQSVLGHSSIVVTQRYAKLSDDAVTAEALRVAVQSVTGAVTRTEQAEVVGAGTDGGERS